MLGAKLMLMAAAAATTLGGADPFIGRWKLNVAKSHYLTGPAPREQTETLSVEGPNLRVRVVGTTADGVKTLVSYWVPYEGGLGHMDAESSSAYDGISGKHLGPREREISRLKGGKVVFTAHAKISADGRTLAVSSKGVSPVGTPVEAQQVYEKID